MSFEDLKNKTNTFEKLQEEIQKLGSSNASSSYEDSRFWKPELDKSGNGFAVIRFLPPPEGEELPWAQRWSHAFRGPGGWYIENSLTTVNKSDPVSEYNSELWNSGNDADKETARKQKRILKYFSNIYVVSDPKHPENEGTVRLFRYGKKVFDKIKESMEPAFEDEKAINPFDFWTGANFKLKIRKVDGYWNYDKSEFSNTSQLLEDEDELKAVYKKMHSLQAFVSPSEFKTYDELKERLDKVLTGSSVTKTAVESISKMTETSGEKNSNSSDVDVDSDETLQYFAKLAADV